MATRSVPALTRTIIAVYHIVALVERHLLVYQDVGLGVGRQRVREIIQRRVQVYIYLWVLVQDIQWTLALVLPSEVLVARTR